jgi:hypothetical protein
MMEAVRTSKKSVNFHQTTWCKIPEHSLLYMLPQEPEISPPKKDSTVSNYSSLNFTLNNYYFPLGTTMVGNRSLMIRKSEFVPLALVNEFEKYACTSQVHAFGQSANSSGVHLFFFI